MTPNRPYLMRALFDWILDNDLTPHLVVDAENKLSDVPRQFVENGRIVLNISPSAVRDLSLENDFVSFNARFSGKPTNISFPTNAVLGIYARENGQGMLFTDETDPESPDTGGADAEIKSAPKKKKPALKVVK